LTEHVTLRRELFKKVFVDLASDVVISKLDIFDVVGVVERVAGVVVVVVGVNVGRLLC
jgi:hypothetical protein